MSRQIFDDPENQPNQFGDSTAEEYLQQVEARSAETLLSYEGMPYPTNGMKAIISDDIPVLMATIRSLRVEAEGKAPK